MGVSKLKHRTLSCQKEIVAGCSRRKLHVSGELSSVLLEAEREFRSQISNVLRLSEPGPGLLLLSARLVISLTGRSTSRIVSMTSLLP